MAADWLWEWGSRGNGVTYLPLTRMKKLLFTISCTSLSLSGAADVIMGPMEEPLKPGQWIDDLPEPLETVADVEDLFRRVDALEAKRLEEATRKAALN